jgi:hypothetical protein
LSFRETERTVAASATLLGSAPAFAGGIVGDWFKDIPVANTIAGGIGQRRERVAGKGVAPADVDDAGEVELRHRREHVSVQRALGREVFVQDARPRDRERPARRIVGPRRSDDGEAAAREDELAASFPYAVKALRRAL